MLVGFATGRSALAEALGSIVRERRALVGLARYDLRRAYAGTGAGVMWAVLAPIAPFVVLAGVFAFGLRLPLGGLPYLYGFTAAYAPWLLLSIAITGATTSIVEHRHLVRHARFPVAVVPASPVLLACVPHVALGAVAIIACLAGGHGSIGALLLVPYFFGCGIVLALGIALVLAPLAAMARDLPQLLPAALQVWFWLTPVAWSQAELPAVARHALVLNPAAYVTSGYRHALLPRAFPAPTIGQSVAFWLIAGAVLFLGASVFARLRPHLWESL